VINKHDQYYYIAKFNLDHNKKKSNLCHYGVLVKVPFLLFFFGFVVTYTVKFGA